MTKAYFLCDQDGNNYGPFFTKYEAQDFLDFLNDQELFAEIIDADLPADLVSQAS